LGTNAGQLLVNCDRNINPRLPPYTISLATEIGEINADKPKYRQELPLLRLKSQRGRLVKACLLFEK
jgi:hypothetical protein